MSKSAKKTTKLAKNNEGMVTTKLSYQERAGLVTIMNIDAFRCSLNDALAAVDIRDKVGITREMILGIGGTINPETGEVSLPILRLGELDIEIEIPVTLNEYIKEFCGRIDQSKAVAPSDTNLIAIMKKYLTK